MKHVRFFFSLTAAAWVASFAAADRLSMDLHEVSNLKAFTKIVPLKKAHLKKLSENRFVVYPSSDQALYWVYGRNDYREIPSIVTTDNVLQIHHIFFDSTLRMVEEGKLIPDLKDLTTKMLEQSLSRYSALKGGPLKDAALRNIAYFMIAAKLLGLEPSIYPEAKDLVGTELAAIDAHEGTAPSAIVNNDVDFSQFVPRGHYTRSPQLSAYFKAMMWFGYLPFSTRTKGEDPNLMAMQQSLLMVRDLNAAKVTPIWNRIYDVTSLYAGKSNSLTPAQWSGLEAKVFGANAPVAAYGDAAKLRAFIKAVEATPRPAIVSKRQRGNPAGAYQFRLMGQRAIPDSRILQELSDAKFRPFPSPLDVFAVLGSPRAKSILDSSPVKWAGYLPRRTALTKEFATLPTSKWSSDLYWSWIDLLRPIAKPVPSNYPAFMQSTAWQDKALYSALASYAELRHDTILYGQQSAAEMGDGDEDQPILRGYIEPNVAVYERLKLSVSQLAKGLRSRGYVIEQLDGQLQSFSDLLSFFSSMSQKELAGKKLTKAEHLRIRKIEGDLESLNTTIMTAANNYKQLTEADLDMALVADIHTAYGAALTIAVGRADHLVAIVPIEGKQVMARGTTLSYYEFKVPISGRMTDEQWKAQLGQGKAPARPDWIKSFFVPIPVKAHDE